MRIVCAARSGGAATSARTERTAIAASEVAVSAMRSSSRSSERSREPYMPRTAQRPSTAAPKRTSHTAGGEGTPADREPSVVREVTVDLLWSGSRSRPCRKQERAEGAHRQGQCPPAHAACTLLSPVRPGTAPNPHSSWRYYNVYATPRDTAKYDSEGADKLR